MCKRGELWVGKGMWGNMFFGEKDKVARILRSDAFEFMEMYRGDFLKEFEDPVNGNKDILKFMHLKSGRKCLHMPVLNWLKTLNMQSVSDRIDYLCYLHFKEFDNC